MQSLVELDRELFAESVVWMTLHNAQRSADSQVRIMKRIDELLDLRIILMRMGSFI